MLILGYLEAAGKLTPEVSMKLEQAINLGYQRLCTFEVSGGGFDWYGHAPANVLLTAYGIQEFTDMNRVVPVDLGIVERAQRWLKSQQAPDGSWSTPRAPYSLGVGSAGVPATAYVAWSLARSGDDSPALKRAFDWLERHTAEVNDPYTLALLANAFLTRDARDRSGLACLEKLLSGAVEDVAGLHWGGETQTLYYGSGSAGSVETTALAALALAKVPAETARHHKTLAWLVKSKDAQGGWHSTQATILAIQALLSADDGKGRDARAAVSVTVNGQPAARLSVTPENADLLQQVDLREWVHEGENRFEIAVEGEAPMAYQVAGRWYRPWSGERETKKPPIEIDVAYDKTTLAVDDFVDCTVTVRYHRPEPTFMVIVDVGLPPGFVPESGSLAELLGQKKIDRWSATGRQLTFYLGEVRKDEPVVLRYSLRAKYPIRAQVPESAAYEYYDPSQRGVAKPVKMEVR